MSEFKPEDEVILESASVDDSSAQESFPNSINEPGETILSNSGKKYLKVVVASVAAVLLLVGFFVVFNANKNSDLSQLQGKVSLSEAQLRDIVKSKHLTVFWAGPIDGAKYTLTASTPGIANVKYLPGGVGLNDQKTIFRAIGTYTQKNAFAIAKNSAKVDGNVGFINSDGNAVFYSVGRPTNVYIGIKGMDIQVEVFDPVSKQSQGLVMIRNQIRQIN